MSHQDDQLPSIEPDALEDVTGGVTSSSSSSSSNTQVTAALQGIMSSLKSIGTANSNSSGNALSQMLPFLLMGRGGAGAGGACPCGCGMANCIRR